VSARDAGEDDRGYASYEKRKPAGRPRIGWRHPGTKEAIERAVQELSVALLGFQVGPHGSLDQLRAMDACCAAARRELALAIAGEEQARRLDR
jgi:hypothetical protein